MPQDIIEQDIQVGAEVAFNPPHYKGLCLGLVVRASDKTVTILYRGDWRRMDERAFLPHLLPYRDMTRWSKKNKRFFSADSSVLLYTAVIRSSTCLLVNGRLYPELIQRFEQSIQPPS